MRPTIIRNILPSFFYGNGFWLIYGVIMAGFSFMLIYWDSPSESVLNTIIFIAFYFLLSMCLWWIGNKIPILRLYEPSLLNSGGQLYLNNDNSVLFVVKRAWKLELNIFWKSYGIGAATAVTARFISSKQPWKAIRGTVL